MVGAGRVEIRCPKSHSLRRLLPLPPLPPKSGPLPSMALPLARLPEQQPRQGQGPQQVGWSDSRQNQAHHRGTG